MNDAATREQASLWSHADFLKLWSAQAISGIGTQVSFLAIPVIAVTFLGASPFQMGLLTAFLTLPSLLFGLIAGSWIDRRSRQLLLIAADIGRAVLLVTIPLAYLAGVLTLIHLYIVAFLFGGLTLVFQVAYRSYLPAIVPRSRLVEANGKLELSRAGTELIGPGLGGLVIRLVTAPFAVLVDVCTYVFSAVAIRGIRTVECADQPDQTRSLWADSREGLHAIADNRPVRALAGLTATISLFNAALEALFVLYIVRVLGIGPGLLGLIFSAGAVGFLVGPVVSQHLIRITSPQTALIAGIFVIGVGDLLVPIAMGPTEMVVGTLVVAQFLFGVGFTTVSIVRVSALQVMMPENLQGRTHATLMMLLGTGALLGGLIGGGLGELIGPRLTLIVAAIGEITAAAWVLRARIRIDADVGQDGNDDGS